MQVDVWSLGVVLYIILAGKPPWPIEEDPAVGSAALTFGEEFDSQASSAAHLVRGMLQIDPNDRLSSLELTTHPWANRDSLAVPSKRAATTHQYNSELQRAPLI